MGKHKPSPEQRTQMLEARLDLIEKTLKSGEPTGAIRHLGNNLSLSTFNPSTTKVESLELYHQAWAADTGYCRRHPHVDRLAQLYAQVVEAFNQYREDSSKGPVTIDDTIECVPVESSQFSAVYRTAETRILDKKCGFSQQPSKHMSDIWLSYGNASRVLSEIASEVGCMVGVKVSELETLFGKLFGEDLDMSYELDHYELLKKTYVAPNGAKHEIVVPLV